MKSFLIQSALPFAIWSALVWIALGARPLVEGDRHAGNARVRRVRGQESAVNALKFIVVCVVLPALAVGVGYLIGMAL